MSKRLRFALVGAGHMGKFHAQAIAERSDTQLVAVCDVDASRAAKMAADFGARVETDVRRLAGEVDAAVIAAATTVHRDVATVLLARGTAVLIEKPLAATAAEARQIADAARCSSAVAQVGHILRFDPVTRAVAGCIGKPGFVEVSWAAPFSARSMDVGVVMDLVIHGLDLVLWMAGESPSRVDAVGGTVIGPHEDFVSVRLAFPGGCVVNLTASRLSRTRQRQVRVFSGDAYLKMDYGARTVERMTPRPGLAEMVRSNPAVGMEQLFTAEKLPVEDKPDGLRAQLASFIGAVRGEHPPAVTLDEGARAVEVAEEIVRQVRA